MNTDNKLKAITDIMESMIGMAKAIDPKFASEIKEEFKEFKQNIDKLQELKDDKFKINSDPGSSTYENTGLMTDAEIRLAIYLDMDKSVPMLKNITEQVEEIFQYIKNGLTKYDV